MNFTGRINFRQEKKRMADIELLSKICKTPGAPGFEQAIRGFLMEQLKDHSDQLRMDAMGNLIAFKRGNGSKKLMFTAHMDEIGFIVQHIDEEGFVRFLPLGGFDPKTLSAQRVIIHGKEDVIGVLGSKPVHLMSPDERNKPVSMKDYFIDTGLPKAELADKIQLGDPITRERELIRMGKCFNSKSLDNRVSVYCLLELMKRISKQPLDFDVYAVFTVQEELGRRGAYIAAHQIEPDIAINVDTTIAYDLPGAQAHEMVTKLGEGVALKLYDTSVLPDGRLVVFLKQLLMDSGIKWQAELLTGGGTDTASVQRAGNGTIAAAISIPTRHIHQSIEMVHEDDVDGAIQLLELLVSRIGEFTPESI